MKEKVILGVKAICEFRGDLLLILAEATDFHPLNKQIIVDSFQNLDLSARLLAYHKTPPPSDIYIVNDAGESKVMRGATLTLWNCGIYKDGLFVKNYAKKTLEWLNPETLELEFYDDFEQPFRVWGAYYYFASKYSIAFQGIEHNRRFEIDFYAHAGEPENQRRSLYFGEKFLLVNYQSGPCLCYDLESENLLWKRERNISQLTVWGDVVYAICYGRDKCGQYTYLEEIEVYTGNALREKDLLPFKNKNREVGFGFSGQLKVYDEYIFCLSTGNRKGVFAVFNRKTFEFIDYISLGVRCSPRVENLHYFDGKVYILDLSEKLHIVEL